MAATVVPHVLSGMSVKSGLHLSDDRFRSGPTIAMFNDGPTHDKVIRPSFDRSSRRDNAFLVITRGSGGTHTWSDDEEL